MGGSMRDIFKPLELDMWKIGQNLCLCLFVCPSFLFCPPHAASLLEGTWQDPNYWELCSYPLF